ncbi:MAG: ABC transporter substrate binding protein [Woeseiaceae bacterium]|nr:ABC transporter substrate binding protein [Woeseiaceae bacterium]
MAGTPPSDRELIRMQRTETPLTRRIRVVAGLAWLCLGGCAAMPPDHAGEVPEPPGAASAEPQIPIVEPVPLPSPPLTPLPPVAIVLSSREPAYEDVVLALDEHFDAYSVYDLSDRSQPAVTAFRVINDSDASAVIAVGLRAAKSALALAGSPVVFSQVFNHHDHSLVGEHSRGVAAFAPLHAQLQAWVELEPELSRIGIIIGEGHEALVAEAESAAERHAIELNIRVARSDQETLYLYKRMVREIDGFWLFPDNRILSARVLRDILDDARRRNISVVVPNDAMLPMGAAISITTVPSDIAARVADVVRFIQAGRLGELPPVTPLTEIRIATNEALIDKRVAAGERARPEDSQ